MHKENMYKYLKYLTKYLTPSGMEKVTGYSRTTTDAILKTKVISDKQYEKLYENLFDWVDEVHSKLLESGKF